MLKKRNLIFICLLILGVFLITSCLPKLPVTQGILKGKVIVPEGSVQAKDLTGQALANATVNIIDPVTGDIIATATTDDNGHYQVFVPAGGPYLLQAVKDNVKVQQFTPQVEVGIEYDLGTADCNTTAVALIALAMLDAEDFPDNLADINLADIAADPNFDDVLSNVTSIIEAGEDPAESAVVQQAVEDFLYPPAPAPTPTPTPTPTYTVTFDSQGGSTVNSQTVSHGGKATEPVDPTREGYTFGGWYKESGCINAWAFATDTVISAVTLYTKWTINTYTVTYDSNSSTGGTVPTDSSSPYDYGATVTVLGNTGSLVRTGHTFASWNTQADGNGIDRAVGSTFIMGASAVTLYAQWTINTYTLTYDSHDGTAVAPQTVEYGGLATKPNPDPTLTNYTFADWHKESTYDNLWDFNNDTVTSDITLHAKWTCITQYALRDTGPAGGLIFYDKGYYSDVWEGQYLEAAPSDQSTGIQWFNGIFVVTGATGTAIGTGQANTTAIVNIQGAGSYAAQLCNDLIVGDYNDWFLPSKDELNLMYTNLHNNVPSVGGFTGDFYWSSSEHDEYSDSFAWYQDFRSVGSGAQLFNNKYDLRQVRAVRAF